MPPQPPRVPPPGRGVIGGGRYAIGREGGDSLTGWLGSWLTGGLTGGLLKEGLEEGRRAGREGGRKGVERARSSLTALLKHPSKFTYYFAKCDFVA